ncbi:NAD(P)/FAD-dependent oxidoreductase [Lacticaseibacillus sp. GG6-2]
MTDSHLYDLIVIGGGPVGMFASFYAGLRDLDTLLVESLPTLGGQVSALYPEKVISDVAGVVPVRGQKLIDNLQMQLVTVADRVTVHCDEEVLSLTKNPDQTFTLTTSRQTTHAKAVLVANGSGAFAPRQLPCDYDHDLDGNRVLYFVSSIQAFANKKVAIAGGGDAAIDWALTLAPVARSVTLIHRRKQFRALEASVNALKDSPVALATPYNIANVQRQDQGVDILLQQVKGETQTHIEADYLLVNYGFTSDNRLVKDCGFDLSRRDLVVDANMQTSLAGVYGIGDAVTYPGKVKLIASGFGEAPTAINHIATALYPERKQPLHSTSL